MTDKEKVLSNDYTELISDSREYWEARYSAGEYYYQQVAGNVGIFYIDSKKLPPLNIENYSYHNIPKLFALLQAEETSIGNGVFDNSALSKSGILQVQRPPLSLTGSGVIIGFIDTGIRYTEDVFRNPDGSSRILAIWDQTIQSGTPPEGMVYGTVYTKDMIDRALETENPRQHVPSWDENGHGTAVASVAAGSILDGASGFQGAAPDCQIVVVKCRDAKPYLKNFYFVPEDANAINETDFILGLRYVEEFTIAYQRPVVICISIGSNLGGHSSGAPLANYVNRTAVRRSRIVVAGGGNEGNTGHHYSGSVRGSLNSNSVNEAEIQVKEGTKGFVAELWGTLPNTLSVSVRSPEGEVTSSVNYHTRDIREFSFAAGSSRLEIDYILSEENIGSELFLFRFTDPAPGVWVIRVMNTLEGSANLSEFNIWLPISAAENVVFLSPDPFKTLAAPSNTTEILSVTAYNQIANGIYALSGRGYTRLDEIKPDVAVPGVDIDTILGKRSGSSMASAIASGAAAQFMQWAVVEGNNRSMSSQELRNYLILGAERSPELTYPNREWGYGKLDIAGTFDTLAGLS